MVGVLFLVLLSLPMAAVGMRPDRAVSWLPDSHVVGSRPKPVVFLAGPEDVTTATTIEQDTPVVLVTVSMDYLDMFKNWLYFAKPFLQGKQLFVEVEDASSVAPLSELFRQQGDEMSVKMHGAGRDLAGKTSEFAKGEWGTLVGRRPQHILRLLQRGVMVLYVDIDTVWLKDPFEDIEAAGSADIYLTEDHPGTTHRPYCTCFIAARPTAASLLVMETWAEKVKGQSTNQGVFNDELFKLKKDNKIGVKVLSQSKYPHGRSPPRVYKKGVTVVHANWMRGLDKKVKWLKTLGLWKPQALVSTP